MVKIRHMKTVYINKIEKTTKDLNRIYVEDGKFLSIRQAGT